MEGTKVKSLVDRLKSVSPPASTQRSQPRAPTGYRAMRPPTSETPDEWMQRNWRHYVITPHSLHFAQCFVDPDEHVRAVYFLWGASGRLLYVGKSCSLRHRLIQHAINDEIPFLYYSSIDADCEHDCFLREIEAAYITALSPPYNRKPQYCSFTNHKRFTAAIVTAWQPFAEVELESERPSWRDFCITTYWHKHFHRPAVADAPSEVAGAHPQS